MVSDKTIYNAFRIHKHNPFEIFLSHYLLIYKLLALKIRYICGGIAHKIEKKIKFVLIFEVHDMKSPICLKNALNFFG